MVSRWSLPVSRIVSGSIDNVPSLNMMWLNSCVRSPSFLLTTGLIVIAKFIVSSPWKSQQFVIWDFHHIPFVRRAVHGCVELLSSFIMIANDHASLLIKINSVIIINNFTLLRSRIDDFANFQCNYQFQRFASTIAMPNLYENNHPGLKLFHWNPHYVFLYHQSMICPINVSIFVYYLEVSIIMNIF